MCVVSRCRWEVGETWEGRQVEVWGEKRRGGKECVGKGKGCKRRLFFFSRRRPDNELRLGNGVSK